MEQGDMNHNVIAEVMVKFMVSLVHRLQESQLGLCIVSTWWPKIPQLCDTEVLSSFAHLMKDTHYVWKHDKRNFSIFNGEKLVMKPSLIFSFLEEGKLLLVYRRMIGMGHCKESERAFEWRSRKIQQTARLCFRHKIPFQYKTALSSLQVPYSKHI